MKLKINSLYVFKFYDHCEMDGCRHEEVLTSHPMILEIPAWLVAEKEHFYIIQLVRASEEANNKYWQVLKSTIISISKC